MANFSDLGKFLPYIVDLFDSEQLPNLGANRRLSPKTGENKRVILKAAVQPPARPHVPRR
jgi:hypothetical protein